MADDIGAGTGSSAPRRRRAPPGRLRGLLTGRRRGWAVVVVGFLGVRVALWVDGARFSTGALRYQWQLLDHVELERNPLVALWDLHTQPPLFNLLVGAVLAWVPAPEAAAFQVLYCALGLTSALLLHELLVAFGARWWVAAAVTVVVFSDPVLIDYEHMVTYECLVTTLLLAVTLACHRYASSPTLRRLALLVGLATMLVLTRALFHPLWLALAVGLVLLLRPPPVPWRRVVPVLAVPLLLVGGLMARNQARFGAFTLSSWFGMNMERGIVDSLSLADKEELIAAGTLSPQVRVQPFSPYDAYRPYVGGCRADHGSPVLDRPEKRGGGVNFNYACFVAVYQQAQSDAWAVVRHRPGRYLVTVRAAATTYVSELDLDVLEHSGTTAVLDTVHDVLGGEVPVTVPYPFGDAHLRVHLTPLVALCGLIGAGARAFRRSRRAAHAGRRNRAPPAGPSRSDEPSQPAESGEATEPTEASERSEADDPMVGRRVTLAFVGLTLAFATLASILFELWENGRFRLPLDPLLFGSALAFVTEAGLRRLDRRRTPASDPERPETGSLAVG